MGRTKNIKNIEDIMKIVNSLEHSGFLKEGVTKTIESEIKEQFISLLKDFLKMIGRRVIQYFNHFLSSLKHLQIAIRLYRGESLKSSATSDGNLNPGVSYIDKAKIQVKINENCLKQRKTIFNHKSILYIYFLYGINL